jgi:hypothetical protein
MSSNKKKQESDVITVESVIDDIRQIDCVRSVAVINDVLAGVILGEVDEVDEEMELAAGVVYLVVGLGKCPSQFRRGIEILAPPKAKKVGGATP